MRNNEGWREDNHDCLSLGSPRTHCIRIAHHPYLVIMHRHGLTTQEILHDISFLMMHMDFVGLFRWIMHYSRSPRLSADSVVATVYQRVRPTSYLII